MVQKKVCMLGSFAVGKTSLVARYVHSIFSEKYHTTLGVKVDKKVVTIEGKEMTLVLWDLAGEDEFIRVQMSYVRGSSGILLVVDGTRPETLDRALAIKKQVEETVGAMPFGILLNKADLVNDWALPQASLDELTALGWHIYKTSARTGQNVEEAFSTLAREMLG